MLSTSRSRRILYASILAAIVTWAGVGPGSLSVSIAEAADPSSDIPGVPLPGPVAAGRLGGAIYDVVYRISVAPGHVILAGVTGTAGTDFDLYLFDASATTVLSNVGLLTRSNDPTSTESISWPSRLGGTYYIDLNGATDVEGDYLLTVQTVPDPTPPIVSIVLAGGSPSTNQVAAVPVILTASDDLSGVTDMSFSGDGSTYAPWQPFGRSTTWAFTPGDGPRRLWVKVKNGVGLESAPANAGVTIDTVPPSAIALYPSPGSQVVGLRPRFTVTFDEPIDSATWNDLGLIVQSATGALVAGGYAYDAAARIGSFIPSRGLEPGAAYVVTVGNVTDMAGNRVGPLGSWSVIPLAPTNLVASAVPKVVTRGGSARLDLILAEAPLPAIIEVSSAPSGSSVFVPSTVITTEDGSASLAVEPTQNTTYRLRYAGAGGVAPSQVDVPVLVRRSIVLVGRSSASVSSARVGASVSIVAAIGPAAAGVPVSFRIYRFDRARQAWVYAGSRGRNTGANGRASFTWVPASSGSWYVRASVASTTDFANNISPVYRWSVSP